MNQSQKRSYTIRCQVSRSAQCYEGESMHFRVDGIESSSVARRQGTARDDGNDCSIPSGCLFLSSKTRQQFGGESRRRRRVIFEVLVQPLQRLQSCNLILILSYVARFHELVVRIQWQRPHSDVFQIRSPAMKKPSSEDADSGGAG